MFKFTPKEIEKMESLAGALEKDNKENPWISGAEQEVKIIEFNGFKWMAKYVIEVIPDQELEDTE